MPNSLFIGYAISQPVYSKCDTADTTKNKYGTWDGSSIRNQNIQNETDTDTCVDKC